MSPVEPSPTHPMRASLQSGARHVITNSVIAGLWLWLYHPVFDYLTIIFAREDFRTNQVLLLAVLILVGLRIRQVGFHLRLAEPPRWRPIPLTFVLGASLLFLVVERFLDINTVSASLFVLASYGLLGLWLEPLRWRSGLPAMLLLIGVLPFGDHLQTFIGYPMRILTASLVRDGLQAAGVATVGVDTILLFENSVAHIDLPCSGIKSLWTGALFLLAATWIDGRPLNLRWLVVGGLMIGLLFVANLGRVAILIAVGDVMGWRLVAAMLHVPLGVLGFVAACGMTLLLLRWLVPPRSADQAKAHLAANSVGHCILAPQPQWLGAGLAASLAVMALLYVQHPQTGLTASEPEWRFPPTLAVEPLPLTPAERAWLMRDGAESATRLRFTWGDIDGSLILITSHTWRAHHRPERCYEVYGLSIDNSQGYLVATDFPVRLVTLGTGDDTQGFSAAYWFQSPTQTTAEYARRMWADLTTQRERWVLVSILFDDLPDPKGEEVDDLYRALRAAVGGTLGE